MKDENAIFSNPHFLLICKRTYVINNSESMVNIHAIKN